MELSNEELLEAGLVEKAEAAEAAAEELEEFIKKKVKLSSEARVQKPYIGAGLFIFQWQKIQR